MEKIKLACGDNNISTHVDKNVPQKASEGVDPEDEADSSSVRKNDNEARLKDRIAQCKDIIASLKLELNEEKIKFSTEGRRADSQSIEPVSKIQHIINEPTEQQRTTEQLDDILLTTNMYSTSVDSKLNCDENLLEYEKQLQRYQNTLNMAQIEKKNAIRKQMLAKAFKLKLLEVENQCNVELLRIKQSLQCLEPLKLIVDKWKTSNKDNIYDINSFELIPRYPELGTHSGSDISSNSNAEDADNKLPI